MPDQRCVHITAIASVKHPKRRECQECVKIGGTLSPVLLEFSIQRGGADAQLLRRFGPISS
jgi:hypothetical protein